MTKFKRATYNFLDVLLYEANEGLIHHSFSCLNINIVPE